MALPEQIRKQTEAVQELYKQLNGDGTNGDGATPPADGGTPPTEPVNTSTPTADENAATENAAQPLSDEHANSGGKDAEETLTQKYRTLQGMYNAEVPRLHSQNKELSGRLQQMEQLLATISAQQSTGRPMAGGQPQIEPLVTDKDQEEYGESLDVMRRVTREELIPVAQKIAQIDRLLQQLQVNVVPQVKNLAQRQAMTAEQQFWADLTTVVPNWRDINEDDDFKTWLLEVDPLTGISRQTILEDAQGTLDVRRVGNFFKSWLEMTGQANVAQNTRRNVSVSELERQVAPGKGRSAGAPTGNAAKTYSPDDIRTFFDAVRQGKYKGREAERDRIERDIFAAQRDGRITVNA
jgi:hypothetical protein